MTKRELSMLYADLTKSLSITNLFFPFHGVFVVTMISFSVYYVDLLPF